MRWFSFWMWQCIYWNDHSTKARNSSTIFRVAICGVSSQEKLGKFVIWAHSATADWVFRRNAGWDTLFDKHYNHSASVHLSECPEWQRGLLVPLRQCCTGHIVHFVSFYLPCKHSADEGQKWPLENYHPNEEDLTREGSEAGSGLRYYKISWYCLSVNITWLNVYDHRSLNGNKVVYCLIKSDRQHPTSNNCRRNSYVRW